MEFFFICDESFNFSPTSFNIIKEQISLRLNFGILTSYKFIVDIKHDSILEKLTSYYEHLHVIFC